VPSFRDVFRRAFAASFDKNLLGLDALSLSPLLDFITAIPLLQVERLLPDHLNYRCASESVRNSGLMTPSEHDVVSFASASLGITPSTVPVPRRKPVPNSNTYQAIPQIQQSDREDLKIDQRQKSSERHGNSRILTFLIFHLQRCNYHPANCFRW
jgi:hypothetical protein